MESFDVIVMGGGQSGLAVGYFLRRTGLSFVILDAETASGGSWQHHWYSLRLFSPAQWSSLPGTLMSGGTDYYPSARETVDYLTQYEQKYQLPVRRPVRVERVSRENGFFQVDTTVGTFRSAAVISATGSFGKPYMPNIPGQETFRGRLLHSSEYQSAAPFAGQRVAVVGEGNSGAQILAELSEVADTLWITSKEPTFLPDYVDGRYLFDAASQMYQAKLQGRSYQPPSLGDVVMVESVMRARDRGVLAHSVRPFNRMSPDGLVWSNGHVEQVDALIFCTGFRPALDHLEGLGLATDQGRIPTDETRALGIAGLWLVGYGNWTGFASATLIGVGRSARQTVEEVKEYLAVERQNGSHVSKFQIN